MKNITRSINNEKLNNEGGTTDSEITSWKVEKIASELSVSTKTVKRLIEDGAFPSVRIRGCIRVPKRAVINWMESQTRYNYGRVELDSVSTIGDQKCNSSRSEMASTTLPISSTGDRLDALLKLKVNT